MEKNLEQTLVVKVGDPIYTPLSSYHPEKNNGAVIITGVAEIIEKDSGEIVIIDSDGDKLRTEWIGVSIFFSIEAMNHTFEKIEQKYGKRCTNSHLCKYYSSCVRQR